MIRTLLIFFLLLGSIWLGVQLHDDPGYVLIALNHWTVEMTIWTTLITLLTLFLILHVFLLSLDWVLHIPDRWSRWINKRSIKRAIAKNHLEKARALKKTLSLKKTPEAFLELGQLLEELNDTYGACATYREGLHAALKAKSVQQ